MDKVTICDPEHPGRSKEIPSANFHPERHTRWEFRPWAMQSDLHEQVVEGDQHPVSEGQARVLTSHGAASLLAILRLGEEGLTKVPTVGRATASSVFAWAGSMPHAEAAREELRIEREENERAEAEESDEEPGESGGEGESEPAPSGEPDDEAGGAA